MSMVFDDDTDESVFDRNVIAAGLATIWICADYLVRKFEREVFSGKLDRRGFRKPKNAVERAFGQQWNEKVRRAAVELAEGIGATTIESEVIRQKNYKTTFERLEKLTANAEPLQMLKDLVREDKTTS